MQCRNVAAVFVSHYDRARNDGHDKINDNNHNLDANINDDQCVSTTDSCERPRHPVLSLHPLIALRNWQPVNLRE